jgi:hypothetical protein
MKTIVYGVLWSLFCAFFGYITSILGSWLFPDNVIHWIAFETLAILLFGVLSWHITDIIWPK